MAQEKSYYRIIVKTRPAPDSDSTAWVKYRDSDLLAFTRFINRVFPNWRFMNVYDKESRTLLKTFQWDNPPTSKRLD